MASKVSSPNAFVYGTLMSPEVLGLLIKRVPPLKPATIKGFTRLSVRDQVFPAIVRSSSESEVKGQVLLGLTPAELHILDVYEGQEYERISVEPTLEEDGSTVEAGVYIWKDEFRDQLEPAEWDYGHWHSQHLSVYLENIRAWMEEDEPQLFASL